MEPIIINDPNKKHQYNKIPDSVFATRSRLLSSNTLHKQPMPGQLQSACEAINLQSIHGHACNVNQHSSCKHSDCECRCHFITISHETISPVQIRIRELEHRPRSL